MARVDLLLHRYAERQDQETGIGSSTDQLALSNSNSNNWLTPTSKPDRQEEWVDAYAAAVERSASLALQAQMGGRPPRLQQLVTAFGLDAFDLDIFLLALLPALNPAIDRFFVYLQDDTALTYPTVKLALDVLCEAVDLSRLTRLTHFARSAPLVRHGLLELSGEEQPLQAHLPTQLLRQEMTVDPAVVAWLLGEYQPHRVLGIHAQLTPAQADAQTELLAAEAWPKVANLGQTRAILAFHGPDAESQDATARLFANQRDCALLTVDLLALLKVPSTQSPGPAAVLRLALRDARLTNAIPYFIGLDACLEEGRLPTSLLTILADFPHIIITSASKSWRAAKELAERPIVYQAFPVPGYVQRQALWSYYLSDVDRNMVDVKALASQFALDGGRIRTVVTAARLIAQRQGRSKLSHEDISATAREDTSTRLGELAHKVSCRHGWEDLVLSPEKIAVLREMVAMVRGRPKVLDEWGVANKLVPSRSVSALFGGEPGTGKTMAAEVIAGDLGFDLYKVDLSSVVDKYIGETEKGLERIFGAAESTNAVLFFDEADSVFGKRTGVKDAHDRYANVGVSYLLQRMESFDGITILATNLQSNLDEAFTRRLNFVVSFPFPGVEERLHIWQTLFPPTVPRAPDVDLQVLAQRFKLSGASIRNIIVSAAYLAADAGEEVTMDHLLHSARRELQKMGRLPNAGTEYFRPEKGIATQ